MLALIDGDILVYRCGFAAEKTRYTLVDGETGIPIEQFDSAKERDAYVKEHQLEGFEVDRERLVEPLSHALQNIKSVIRGILDDTGADDYIIFLSSGENFRNSLATILEYKANRKDAPKPVHYAAIWEYLQKEYNTYVCQSIEADDALALCQTEDSVIVSIDKDLLQIPGRHFNWVRHGTTDADGKEVSGKILVAPEVGIKKLYQQVLTGDPTDNIPGIRGLGPVKARKMLSDIPPDKKALSDVCTRAWEEFILTGPEFDGRKMQFEESEDGRVGVTFESWTGDQVVVPGAQFIAAEVFHLVQVGGRCAKEALEETGESLPLPISTKG